MKDGKVPDIYASIEKSALPSTCTTALRRGNLEHILGRLKLKVLQIGVSSIVSCCQT